MWGRLPAVTAGRSPDDRAGAFRGDVSRPGDIFPESREALGFQGVAPLRNGARKDVSRPETSSGEAKVRPLGPHRGEKYPSSGYVLAEPADPMRRAALASARGAEAKRRTARGTSFRRGTCAAIEGRSKRQETGSFRPPTAPARFALRSRCVFRSTRPPVPEHPAASDDAPSCPGRQPSRDLDSSNYAPGASARGRPSDRSVRRA